MTLSTAHSLAYRPDIDGLRAVAVIAVVITHLFPALLPGGYVGVDIFFVISGYLISSLIFKELIDHSFSFADFYKRRIKRIFPTLLLILTFVTIGAWLICIPSEFSRIGGLINATTTFSVNFTLSKGASYFDINAPIKSLLHIWSLSLEEQFYILFPIAAVLSFKRARSFFYPLLILITVTSFFINVYYLGSKPIKVFYMLPSRAWELLLGSLLAYHQYFQSNSCFSAWMKKNHFFLSLLGVALIASAYILFNEKLPFPGWYALIPTSGALLLIMTPYSWINQRILSNRLAVQTGLISYALYLWHWPLFSLTYIYTEGHVDTSSRLIIAGLSLILAWVTTQYLEKPVRASTSSKTLYFLTGFMAFFFSLSFFMARDYIKPLTVLLNPDVAKIDFAINDWKPALDRNFNDKDKRQFPFRSFGKGNKIILFFGDSNMEQYQPRVEKLMSTNEELKQKYTVIFANHGGQIPLFDKPKHQEAAQFLDKVKKFVKDPRIHKVVICGQWMGYFKDSPENDEPLYASLQQQLMDLKNLHKKVYFILNMPIGSEFDPRQQISRENFVKWHIKTDVTCDGTSWLKNSRRLMDRLTQIAQATGAYVIDPYQTLCPNHRCLVRDATNTPIYKDVCHFTSSFAREHATFVNQIFQD